VHLASIVTDKLSLHLADPASHSRPVRSITTPTTPSSTHGRSRNLVAQFKPNQFSPDANWKSSQPNNEASLSILADDRQQRLFGVVSGGVTSVIERRSRWSVSSNGTAAGVAQPSRNHIIPLSPPISLLAGWRGRGDP